MAKTNPVTLRGNLPSGSTNSIYDHQLFKSRKALIENNLFERLETELLQWIYAEYEINDHLTILNTSMGYDPLFEQVLLCMQWDQYRHHAISSDNPQLPYLEERSVHVIMNTLSDASYRGFNRILKPGGLLLKTIPGPSFPLEQASLLYQDTYDYDETVALFHRQNDACTVTRICSNTAAGPCIDLTLLCGRKRY